MELLIGQKPQEKQQAKDVQVVYYTGFMSVKYAPSTPVYLQRCLAMVMNWMPTTGLKPSQGQPGPAYTPWSLSSRQQVQGNTICCEMVFLLKLEFWDVEKNLIANIIHNTLLIFTIPLFQSFWNILIHKPSNHPLISKLMHHFYLQ